VPSTVEQLSPTRVKITVEVPFADLKPSMDKAYRQIAQTVNVPGFRQGKVPPVVIDQRFGRGAIIQEALNEALPQFYGQAVEDNNLNPLAQPEVEVTRLEDGDLIEFTAEVDVRPEFDLPDFASLEVTVDALEVPEDLINDQVDLLRNRFGSRETVDRPAEDGDILTIDLVASKDGQPLDDATAEGLDYTVGSAQMLEGLDAAVIGLSEGESNQFTSTLVGGPLKDEEADIEVTVTKVQKQELPEADDDFAQLASEFDTIEELRADLGSRLTAMARLEQAAKARDAVLEAVIAQVDLDVPEQLLATELDARKEQITSQLAEAQLTLDQYLSEAEDDEDEEGFWAGVEKRSTDALKAQMVLDKVAEEREITVDQNDLTQHIIRKAQQENTTPNEIAQHLQEHPHHIEEYMLEIRRGKSLALVVESATVKDSNGETIDLRNLQPDGTVAEPVLEGSTDEDSTIESSAAVSDEDAPSDEDDEAKTS
jgi:trigger factor